MFFCIFNCTDVPQIDITASVPENILYIADPPSILKVTNSFKIFAGAWIGISSLFIAFLFYVVVKYRQHKVMTLAQGDILAMFIVFAFWSTVSSFLHIPLSDLSCLLRGPMIMIPLTLLASTLVGRLWRVHTTLKVASSLGRKSSTSIQSVQAPTDQNDAVRKLKEVASTVATTGEQRIMSFLSFLALSRIRKSLKKGELVHRSRSFRQTITRNDTIRLIIILSLPQIILQICDACLYEWKMIIDYNEDLSIGREICESPEQRWTGILSSCLLIVNYGLAVLVAHFSRDLPTAFNERDQIFQVASICSLIGVGIIVVLALSMDSGHPNLIVSMVQTSLSYANAANSYHVFDI
jgi:hypothetical protein